MRDTLIFIGILEKVHDVLKPHGEPLEPLESDSEITLVDSDLASLTLEELPEQSQPPGPRQPPPNQPQVEYQAEPIEDASRMLFAAFAMFHDINKIFGYISYVWQSYRRHEVDLVTVAIAANTATDFVRRLEGEFFAEFKAMKNVEQLINCLYMLKCDADGVRPEARPSQRDLAPFNLDRYDLVRWLFLDTLSLLSAFVDAAGSNQILVYKPGTYGTYEPKVNREKLSNAEKFREDKIVLLEALPDFTVLARFTKSILAEDELTRGIRLLLEKKELHLWTLFAAQSFLEAHHVLREDIGTSFDQLQTLGKKAKDAIARVRHFQTSKNLQLENWPAENDQAIQTSILDVIDSWIFHDEIKATMKRMTQKQGLPLPPGEFHLLRQHPLLCGLFAFFINMQMQEAGVTYANAWGTVLYTAHLYNAVEQEGFTQSSWPDMQMLTHLQTPERLFVGGAPSNAQDYLKRFTLCMGYAAEQYARNRRTHTPVASKTGPRGLRELGEISQIFKKRYCENSDLHDWSLENVEQILNAKYKVSKSTDEPEKNGVTNIELQEQKRKINIESDTDPCIFRNSLLVLIFRDLECPTVHLHRKPD